MQASKQRDGETVGVVRRCRRQAVHGYLNGTSIELQLQATLNSPKVCLIVQIHL